MDRGLDVFGPPFAPFHRTVEFESEITQQSFFGIDVELAAETTSNVRRDYSYLILGQFEHLGEMALKHVRDLCR